MQTPPPKKKISMKCYDKLSKQDHNLSFEYYDLIDLTLRSKFYALVPHTSSRGRLMLPSGIVPLLLHPFTSLFTSQLLLPQQKHSYSCTAKPEEATKKCFLFCSSSCLLAWLPLTSSQIHPLPSWVRPTASPTAVQLHGMGISSWG